MTGSRLALAGFFIRRTTTAAVTRYLHAKLRRRQRAIVLFANANFALQCKDMRCEIARSSDIIVLNDGIAVDIAAKIFAGARFQENLNGTDFTPAFLSTLDPDTRVFLFGARPEVVEQAGQAVRCLFPIEVCGTQDGYFVWEDEPGLIQRINAAKPDVLLVGMGNPLQERWILRSRAALEVPVILAVGAYFDFVSGNVPRAPRVVRHLRLEWAYRLFKEPRRLIGRYSIGIIRFFMMALFDRYPR